MKSDDNRNSLKHFFPVLSKYKTFGHINTAFSKEKILNLKKVNNITVFCNPHVSNAIRILSENSFDIALHVCNTLVTWNYKKAVLKNFLDFTISQLGIIKQDKFTGPSYRCFKKRFPDFLFYCNLFAQIKIQRIMKISNIAKNQISIICFIDGILVNLIKIVGNIFPISRRNCENFLDILIKYTRPNKKKFFYGIRNILWSLIFSDLNRKGNRNLNPVHLKPFVFSHHENYYGNRADLLLKFILNSKYIGQKIIKKVVKMSIVYANLNFIFNEFNFSEDEIKNKNSEIFTTPSQNPPNTFPLQKHITLGKKKENNVAHDRFKKFITVIEEEYFGKYPIILYLRKPSFINIFNIFNLISRNGYFLKNKDDLTLLVKFVLQLEILILSITVILFFFADYISSRFFKNFFRNIKFQYYQNSGLKLSSFVLYNTKKHGKKMFGSFFDEKFGTELEYFLEKIYSKKKKKLFDFSKIEFSFFFFFETIDSLKISLSKIYHNLGQIKKAYSILNSAFEFPNKHINLLLESSEGKTEVFFRKKFDLYKYQAEFSHYLDLGKITDNGKFFEILINLKLEKISDTKKFLATWLINKKMFLHCGIQLSVFLSSSFRDRKILIIYGYLEMKRKRYNIAAKNFLNAMVDSKKKKKKIWKKISLIIKKMKKKGGAPPGFLKNIVFLKKIPFLIYKNIILMLLNLKIIFFNETVNIIQKIIGFRCFVNFKTGTIFSGLLAVFSCAIKIKCPVENCYLSELNIRKKIKFNISNFLIFYEKNYLYFSLEKILIFKKGIYSHQKFLEFKCPFFENLFKIYSVDSGDCKIKRVLVNM